MAPALAAPPPPQPVRDLADRRRALSSVDNITHMEEDDMGLQSQPSLAKDSQEMEQILGELGSSDLAQTDLFQALKSLESAGDGLSTGDADAIFPLSGFDLAEAADSEGDSAEDKIRLLQARLERRCSFLQRRLRILQARAIGKRVSEEAAQTFEKCAKSARKDGGGRPPGLKALLKKVETTAALQASAASRSVVGPKYYHVGSSKGDAARAASIGISSGTLTGLQETAGSLRSHLSVVKQELDSDATASSSGAESNDEAVAYNNPHQQQLQIEKRALWSWQRTRASIASRWSWLQAQVQELEYKIRQHNDLHTQVRESKGRVELVGEPSAYQGSLPGSEPQDNDPSMETCARVRPLRRETFKKRKLLQMQNLHIATSKAAKPVDVNCSCQWRSQCCPLCTGRAEATEPSLPARRGAQAVDHCYHPVLSDHTDITESVHLAALTSRSWLVSRVARDNRDKPQPKSTVIGQHKVKVKKPHHPTRLKRGRPPLSRKIREREREEDSTTTIQERRAVEWRARRPSYDIDNIVIPHSVAAATRPTLLTYKEILTPKWRLMDLPGAPLNNGVMKSNRINMSEEEDISEAAVSARHQRAEGREKARYARARRPPRATDAHHPASDAHHPASDVHLPPTDGHHPAIDVNLPLTDGLHLTTDAHHPVTDGHLPPTASPHPATPPKHPADNHVATPPPPPTPPRQPPPHTNNNSVESSRPYSPRKFPLKEDMYMTMLSVMPEGYRQLSPEPTKPEEEDDFDNSSTLSPLSPTTPYDDDDPDDIEWDPRTEKTERRKSAFR